MFASDYRAGLGFSPISYTGSVMQSNGRRRVYRYTIQNGVASVFDTVTDCRMATLAVPSFGHGPVVKAYMEGVI